MGAKRRLYGCNTWASLLYRWMCNIFLCGRKVTRYYVLQQWRADSSRFSFSDSEFSMVYFVNERNEGATYRYPGVPCWRALWPHQFFVTRFPVNVFSFCKTEASECIVYSRCSLLDTPKSKKNHYPPSFSIKCNALHCHFEWLLRNDKQTTSVSVWPCSKQSAETYALWVICFQYGMRILPFEKGSSIYTPAKCTTL